MERGEGERRLHRLGRSAWSIVGIALVVAMAWFLIEQAGQVLVPLALALFPAAILTPPARWLERRGLGRTTSSVLVMVVAGLVVVATTSMLVVQVQSQAGDLVEQSQEGYETLRTRLDRGAFGLPPIDLDGVVEQLREGVTSSGSGGEAGAEGEGEGQPSVVRALSSSATLLAQLFFAIAATFLFVRDGDRMTAWIRQLFPAHWRPHVRTIGEDMGGTLGNYVRAQATVAAIDAVFIGLGLVVMGVPLAASLTVLVFISAFVPIVGAVVSGAAAALVALAAGGFTDALIVVAIVVVVQQIEGNILQPWIMGHRVDLHPLAVLTILSLGAFLWGLPGAILAVPLSAAAYRALDHLVAIWREDGPAVPGEHPEHERDPDPDPDIDLRAESAAVGGERQA